MVVVPAGEFMMGSTAFERRRAVDQGAERSRVELEKPQHHVTIAEPFAAGKYEVTFDEWEACVKDGGCGGYKPGDEGWGRGRRPVVNVSWNDAKAYVEWLDKKTGKPYGLLSEAEWEYAARAGTTTRYWWGTAVTRENANYGGYLGKTAEVGSYPPNPWGLYDMNGNVWEWGEDCIYNSYVGAPDNGSAWNVGECSGGRVARGGSWDGDPWAIRSAIRGWTGSNTDRRGEFEGFRVARTLSQSESTLDVEPKPASLEGARGKGEQQDSDPQSGGGGDVGEDSEPAAATPPFLEAKPSHGGAEQQSTVKPEKMSFSDARVENDFFVFEDNSVRTYQFGVIDAKFIFRPKQDIKVLLTNDWLWIDDGIGNSYRISKIIGYFKECEYKSNRCLEKDFELFERNKDVKLWFKITALDRDYYKNNRPQQFKFLLKFLIFRPDRNVVQPVAIKVPLRSR